MESKSDALTLSKRFKWHGENIYGAESVNSSPLYAYLSMHVAEDREILELTAGADLSQQVSNLLFGAVHYLLLSGSQSTLRDYYASLTDHPKAPSGAYDHFRAFCLANAFSIRKLVSERRVQTNEVQRCTGLLPAFDVISKRLHLQPLTMIEIGCSLGLNLLWNEYAYYCFVKI